MAVQKSTLKTPKNTKKSEKGFEETLWDSANKLRGSVESSEYKHVVLSLIFLKFASDKFEARRQELIEEGYRQSKKFSCENSAAAVIESYQKALG